MNFSGYVKIALTLTANSRWRLNTSIPAPSIPNVPEVVTIEDDVRYCGNSGLTADVEFSARL
jgi:hypothetical protein